METPKFKTEWERGEETYTNAGTPTIDIYMEALDKNGKKYLKKKGESNIYEKIQASLEETKTYNILEKFLQSGDASILQRRETIFGDFTNIPKTPIELQNMIIEAESQFEQLDKDVREAFENDSGMFKQAILDGTFDEKIKKFKTKQQKTNEKQEIKSEKIENTETKTNNEGVNLNE